MPQTYGLGLVRLVVQCEGQQLDLPPAVNWLGQGALTVWSPWMMTPPMMRPLQLVHKPPRFGKEERDHMGGGEHSGC